VTPHDGTGLTHQGRWRFVHIELGMDAAQLLAANSADGVAFELAAMCAAYEAPMCA
jgi:hypothetical protein